MSEPIQEPPDGCQGLPTFILTVVKGECWLTQYGAVTRDWSKRGVWKTAEEAEKAKALFTE